MAAINNLFAYFDLQSKARGQPRLTGTARGTSGGNLTVLPQYGALLLGIAVQPYFENYRQTGSWAFDVGSAIGWLVFAMIAGLIVFPSVYRKSFDPEQPRFVQFCTVFAGGMGWKALLDTALKVGQTLT